MATCPSCHDDEGRPREIPITVTRWTPTGTETTLRCPSCGWQGTRLEPGLVAGDADGEHPGRDAAQSRAA